MIALKPSALLILAVIPAVGIAVAGGQGPATTGPYTAEQAGAGRAAYQANCANCHRPDLQGSGEAPQLAGVAFMNVWRDSTTRDLFASIRSTMPPANAGALGNEAYLNIVAYILQANGALDGPEALTPATVATIGSIATGQVPPALAAERARPPLPAHRAAGAVQATSASDYVGAGTAWRVTTRNGRR